MKKVMALATILTATVLTACSKNAPQNQVFGQASNTTATVQQLSSLADDSRVTLEGKLLSRIDDDEYKFQDSTGTIKVEIENHVWNGLNVTPADKIRIQGKLDKEAFDSSIDVYSVEKVQ